MSESARQFLTTLWGAENLYPNFAELRFASPKDRIFVKRYFNSVFDLASAAEALDQQQCDCYYGVLPRTMMSKGEDMTVAATRWLWADLDTKGRSRLEAIAAINRIELLPTLLVDSGNGFHAYWKLKKPLAVADAASVMKGMAIELESDHVQNAGRILRIPGTHNWKTKEAPEVRLLWDTGKEYRIGLFERFLGPLLPLAPSHTKRLKPFKGDLDEAAPKGTRSERDFKTVIHMLESGWTDEEIRSAFSQHPHGIGSKYTEKGKSGDKYLTTTIDNARKHLDTLRYSSST